MIHDPKAWGVNPEIYAHELTVQASDISDPLTRARTIKDINHQLQSVQRSGETTDKPFVKEQLEFLKKDFDTRTATVPVLGVYVRGGADKITDMPQSEIDANWGKGASREDLIKRAGSFVERFRGTYTEQMKKFLDYAKANPDATPEDLVKARQDIQRPHIEARVNEAFNGPKPEVPKSYSKGEVRKQDGKMYKYDGTEWAEVEFKK